MKRVWDYIRKRRQLLNGSIFEYLVLGLVFLVLASFYTNFVILNITTQVFTAFPGDGTGGFMWYNFAQPGFDLTLEPSDMVNYPYGEPIGGPTFFTYMAIWIPIRILGAIFGYVAGMNILMHLVFILSALSAYWFIKRLTSSAPAAFFAGFAMAFSPYVIQKSFDQLPYTLSFLFVFILAAFMALWVRPTVWRAVLLAVFLCLTYYSDGYYLLIASVFMVGLVLAGCVQAVLMKMNTAAFWKRVKMLLIAAGFVAVLMLPVAIVQLADGSNIKSSLEGRRSDIAKELYIYRTSVVDFLLPSRFNPFFDGNQSLNEIHNIRDVRSNPGESTNYIGYIIILLNCVGAITAIVWLRNKKIKKLKDINTNIRKLYILMACITGVFVPIALAFMFSPNIVVFGQTIPLPGQLFIDKDISLWRVMARFFIPLRIVMVLFAAFTLGLFFSTHRIREMNKTRMNIITWGAALVLVAGLAVGYATRVNRPSYSLTQIKKGYSWLRDQHNIERIVELPIVDPLDQRTADNVTNQLVHGKKLLNAKESTTFSITNVLGGISNPETIDWAYSRGAQAVITHDECKQVSWGTILYDSSNTSEDKMCIYSLERGMTFDKTFVRFRQGFLQRPNAPNQEQVYPSKDKVTMEITDNKFDRLKKPNRVSLGLSLIINDPELKSWKILQDGKIIGNGEASLGVSTISVEVDGASPIELQVIRHDTESVELGDYIITNTIANKVDDK